MNTSTDYRIIHSGCFTEQDFEYDILPGKRGYTPKVQKLIKAAWDDARLNPDLILFNGKVVSLIDITVGSRTLYGCESATPNTLNLSHTENTEEHGKDDMMFLTVQSTDYRSFYGTNLSNPFIIPKAQLANPLAACAVVETIEGTVFVGERNKRLAEVSGLWHVPGGTLDEAINPIDFMRKELSEELNISSENIQSAVCLGLAENLLMQKPEFLCYFHLRLSERELTEKALTAKDREEHTDFLFVPMEELAHFVEMHPFAAIGKACVKRYLEYVNGITHA